MNEAFLHHIWKFKLFNKEHLATVDGEEIEILKTGQHNTDAGPDFFNAQVRISGTTWAGNVEIHIRSSDWKRHQHIRDAAYNNVVLHVVFEHDEDVFTKEMNKLPTLELKGRFNPEIFSNYERLVDGNRRIPCENHIGKIDEITISTWLERMLVERLERRNVVITEFLKQNKNNWEVTFYHLLARNFGFNTNALPFEMLAKSLPHNLLARHKNNLLQIESLLFGQAGFLEKKHKAAYPAALRNEYNFLREKYSLTPLQPSQWKFFRLRPSNFPTIRIAQFAMLMHNTSGLVSKILETENLKALELLFDIEVSPFWKSHYTFAKSSVQMEKPLGTNARQIILVNSAVPIIFAYGKYYHDEVIQNRAMKFLEELPPEKNSITTMWADLGITSANAGLSQALIHLKNEYCDRKKCLFCSLGNRIVSSVR